MIKKKKLDYDEETVSEKVKEKSSVLGIIGLGILGFVHTLSHVIPAIGALAMSQVEVSHEQAMYVLGVNVTPILTNPVMEVAYMVFVPLSFYYIYRDHVHHKHERKIRLELERTKKELEELKRKK